MQGCGGRLPHLIKWLYHPDQLMHPMKRAGERGENKWEKVSWEQALDEIANKLTQLKSAYGPECLAVKEGTYRSDLYPIRSRFLNLFGNPGNFVGPGTVCQPIGWPFIMRSWARALLYKKRGLQSVR
jgi:anaerobic selenocysteine-containing dehydrogenase